MINNLKKSWSVGYKMKIDSNVDDLWNVITKPGHLEMVHPFCKENYPILWDKENSKDVLVYTNGVKLIREFKSWNVKQGYSLEIGTKNGRKSLVEWEISAENQKTYFCPFLGKMCFCKKWATNCFLDLFAIFHLNGPGL